MRSSKLSRPARVPAAVLAAALAASLGTSPASADEPVGARFASDAYGFIFVMPLRVVRAVASNIAYHITLPVTSVYGVAEQKYEYMVVKQTNAIFESADR